ncbi:hypothetical protein [Thalassoroseus pseudoceratinae]|uniref:hypothetical protein n=1 Tax=Thalassoroseus pseudoceratinae TaxID=2713176 RepID=UPI00142444CF|nr:hypothetical protein [Thalassoroseus pseudoceratinae]
MEAFSETVLEYLEEHWIELLVAAGSAAVGWFFGRRRAASEWRKREFYDRLNVSLTSIHDGKLRIRTLIEKRCDEVFLNRVASETVITKARQTTTESCLLDLPKDDYWFYLNSVLNEVSERFAEGQVRRDLHADVCCARYLICLTSEAAGSVRTRKVRAMVVQQSLLENIGEEPPEFESPNHLTRWETMKELSVAWKKTPWKFQSVEICM